MAFHGLGHRMVCPDLSCLPAPTNPTSRHPINRRHACTPIRQDVYGYDAPPLIRRIFLYCPGAMLTHSLSGVPDALEGNRSSPRRLDLPGHTLSLRDFSGDSL